MAWNKTVTLLPYPGGFEQCNLCGFWFQSSQRGILWRFRLSTPYLWRKSHISGVWRWLSRWIHTVLHASAGCGEGSVQTLDRQAVGGEAAASHPPTLSCVDLQCWLPCPLLSGVLHQQGHEQKKRNWNGRACSSLFTPCPCTSMLATACSSGNSWVCFAVFPTALKPISWHTTALSSPSQSAFLIRVLAGTRLIPWAQKHQHWPPTPPTPHQWCSRCALPSVLMFQSFQPVFHVPMIPMVLSLLPTTPLLWPWCPACVSLLL